MVYYGERNIQEEFNILDPDNINRQTKTLDSQLFQCHLCHRLQLLQRMPLRDEGGDIIQIMNVTPAPQTLDLAIIQQY